MIKRKCVYLFKMVQKENIDDLSKQIVTNSNPLLDDGLLIIQTKNDISSSHIKDSWMWFRNNNLEALQKFKLVPSEYSMPQKNDTLYDLLNETFIKFINMDRCHSLLFCFPNNMNIYIVYLTEEWKEKLDYTNNFMYVECGGSDWYNKLLSITAFKSATSQEHTLSNKFDAKCVVTFNKYEKIILNFYIS
jgi:hypothetical protein